MFLSFAREKGGVESLWKGTILKADGTPQPSSSSQCAQRPHQEKAKEKRARTNQENRKQCPPSGRILESLFREIDHNPSPSFFLWTPLHFFFEPEVYVVSGFCQSEAHVILEQFRAEAKKEEGTQ